MRVARPYFSLGTIARATQRGFMVTPPYCFAPTDAEYRQYFGKGLANDPRFVPRGTVQVPVYSACGSFPRICLPPHASYTPHSGHRQSTPRPIISPSTFSVSSGTQYEHPKLTDESQVPHTLSMPCKILASVSLLLVVVILKATKSKRSQRYLACISEQLSRPVAFWRNLFVTRIL